MAVNVGGHLVRGLLGVVALIEEFLAHEGDLSPGDQDTAEHAQQRLARALSGEGRQAQRGPAPTPRERPSESTVTVLEGGQPVSKQTAEAVPSQQQQQQQTTESARGEVSTAAAPPARMKIPPVRSVAQKSPQPVSEETDDGGPDPDPGEQGSRSRSAGGRQSRRQQNDSHRQ